MSADDAVVKIRVAREIVLDLLSERFGWDGEEEQPYWQTEFAAEFVERAQ